MTARRLLLAVLAGIGLVAAFVVLRDYVLTGALGDECAYRLATGRILAGEPLYDPLLPPGTPCAYFYPPAIAQLIVAVYALIETPVMAAAAAIALAVGSLLYLAGPRPWPMRLLIALAFIAFLPVAAELKFRNLHLPLAVAMVAGLRGHPWALAIGAAVKFSPLVGIAHLIGQRDYRGARQAILCGLTIVLLGVTIAPELWIEWLTVMSPSATDGFPYLLRLAIAATVAGVGARLLPPRLAEPLTIVATIAASPVIWATSFVFLIALPRLAQTRR